MSLKLNNAEKSAIRILVTGDTWDIIMRVLNDRLDEIGRREVTGQNAFEELRALHKREGAKEELVAFFDLLERKTSE